MMWDSYAVMWSVRRAVGEREVCSGMMILKRKSRTSVHESDSRPTEMIEDSSFNSSSLADGGSGRGVESAAIRPLAGKKLK